MENQDDQIENLTGEKAIEKLQELVGHTNTCLFATNLNQAPIQTRPMATQAVDDEGCFWFFRGEESEKNVELKKDPKVQLFYANPGKSEFMTVFGRAAIIKDQDAIEEHWTPMVKAWLRKVRLIRR